MRIVNPNLIASYRVPGKCRFCGKPCKLLCGHHLWSKGSGGPDIPANLVSVGFDPFGGCSCHVSHHAGNEPTFEQLLAISAVDHDCLAGDLESLIHLIQRLPPIRDVTVTKFGAACARELNFGAKRLAMNQLRSFRHLLAEEI